MAPWASLCNQGGKETQEVQQKHLEVSRVDIEQALTEDTEGLTSMIYQTNKKREKGWMKDVYSNRIERESSFSIKMTQNMKEKL